MFLIIQAPQMLVLGRTRKKVVMKIFQTPQSLSLHTHPMVSKKSIPPSKMSLQLRKVIHLQFGTCREDTQVLGPAYYFCFDSRSILF